MQQQTCDQKVHFGHRYSCQDADRVYTLIDTVVEIKTLKNEYLSHCLKKKEEKMVMDLQSQFFVSKIIRIILIEFMKGTNLGAHFLLLTFLITSIFKSLYY